MKWLKKKNSPTINIKPVAPNEAAVDSVAIEDVQGV